MNTTQFVAFLRKLADAAERDPSGFSEWVGKSAAPSKLPPVKKSAKGQRPSGSDPALVARALEDLQRSESREQGFDILKNLSLSRRELEAVAKARSIHVARDDNLARLEEKLVEHIIGSRLNSLAIRGTPPDSNK